MSTLSHRPRYLNIQRLAFIALIAASTLGATPAALAQLKYIGSDSLEPVVDAAQLAFARSNAGYKVQISGTGTSPGLRELCTGRAALVGASRPIKPDEAKDCAGMGVQYSEIPVALDAVVMVVSTKNTWLKELTLAELSTIFAPVAAGKLMSWKQVRPAFADLPLRTAGVGVKHATFGFFADALGLKGFVRSDLKDFAAHSSTGAYVASDAAAIGFISMGEAKALEGQVRIVSLNIGGVVVTPDAETVKAGKYDQLTRTLYFYINPTLLAKGSAQDKEFMRLLVTDTEKLATFANLVPLRSLQYQENKKRFAF